MLRHNRVLVEADDASKRVRRRSTWRVRWLRWSLRWHSGATCAYRTRPSTSPSEKRCGVVRTAASSNGSFCWSLGRDLRRCLRRRHRWSRARCRRRSLRRHVRRGLRRRMRRRGAWRRSQRLRRNMRRSLSRRRRRRGARCSSRPLGRDLRRGLSRRHRWRRARSCSRALGRHLRRSFSR